MVVVGKSNGAAFCHCPRGSTPVLRAFADPGFAAKPGCGCCQWTLSTRVPESLPKLHIFQRFSNYSLSSGQLLRCATDEACCPNGCGVAGTFCCGDFHSCALGDFCWEGNASCSPSGQCCSESQLCCSSGQLCCPSRQWCYQPGVSQCP